MPDLRTFTNADDQHLEALIASAQQRLIFAAPGLTDGVAKAISARILSTEKPPQLAVILDVDPEVCRLGYGTVTALETVTKALESRGLRLQTAEGLRVGLLISDDQTLIYSPTPLLIEEGSEKPDKPNAILLKPNPAQSLAEACGVSSADAPELKQEIGLDCLNTGKLAAVKRDLEENPPKKFELARIERVFNYELQFVEFKVEKFQLTQKTVPLEPGWLGLGDKELKDRFRNTFKLFDGSKNFVFTVPALDDDGKPIDKKTCKLSEETIWDEAKRIRKLLIPLGDYGSVILKRKKTQFQKQVDRLKMMVEVFSEKVQQQIEAEIATARERLVKDLAPGLKEKPPKEWVERSRTGKLTLSRVRELLDEELNRVFATISRELHPQVICIYKDVTYTTIVNDPKFREKLEAYFGKEDVKALFEEHHAAREKPTSQEQLSL